MKSLISFEKTIELQKIVSSNFWKVTTETAPEDPQSVALCYNYQMYLYYKMYRSFFVNCWCMTTQKNYNKIVVYMINFPVFFIRTFFYSDPEESYDTLKYSDDCKLLNALCTYMRFIMNWARNLTSISH